MTNKSTIPLPHFCIQELMEYLDGLDFLPSLCAGLLSQRSGPCVIEPLARLSQVFGSQTTGPPLMAMDRHMNIQTDDYGRSSTNTSFR